MKILITFLHAVRWGVDAWKTAVKPSTLENCFEATQVKLHRPFLPTENIAEVEDEILDCIRVVHPDLQLSRTFLHPQFIDPPSEIVDNPISDIEDTILATYLPTPATESEPEPEAPPPPLVTPSAALAYIEGLLLFSLQAERTANIIELQDVLKRENKRIETLEVQRRTRYIQRRITDFLPPHPPPS